MQTIRQLYNISYIIISGKTVLQNKGEIKTLTDGSQENSSPADLHYKK